MITKAFTVYDSKAMFYSAPWFMPTVGAAVRAFSDMANDPSTTLNRHGSDFILYEVGTFDDSCGVVTPIQPFINLGSAATFIEVKSRTPITGMMPEVVLNGGER